MTKNFEWDEEKSRNNARKHKVAFEEAQTVFLDPLAITISDPEHSVGEDRYITAGLSIGARLLVVVYVERGDRTRIISARKATRIERKLYEEEELD